MSALPEDPEEQSTPVADTASDDGDEQLTIRIPNPKVYMARQSQWVGRRGKPRCDSCRNNNFKCDRATPACNHCSWASTNCKYTPLPTPAHRGIPRCDRCRAHNFKCDRNLPICNKCVEVSPAAECNYTPKKRLSRKASQDPTSNTHTSSLNSRQTLLPVGTADDPDKIRRGSLNNHTFYGHNIAVAQTPGASSMFSETMRRASDQDCNHTGRFTADIRQDVVPRTSFIEPWQHPSCSPLPDYILDALHRLDASTMTDRLEFERRLSFFLDNMMRPLQEVASFPLEKYLAIRDSLLRDNTNHLSERLRSWIAMHKLCLGSERYNLIMIPRDSVFAMDPAMSDTYRRRYAAVFSKPPSEQEDLQVTFYNHYFDILPVREQLYDILTYAHRSHSSATQMVNTILRLRYACITWPMADLYVSLCPVCNPQDTDSD
ncbi:hypothetical protein CPC08DRAFT_633607 [Agrocybe pediades]|nr:hypothetical protein CPC08DRAFT_633607 [Agrocybe pediades]